MDQISPREPRAAHRDSRCLDPVAKSELDANRYLNQDSRPLSKVLASFHGQHPESAPSLVTGLLWQDSLDTGPYTLESLFLLSSYCYQKLHLLLRKEVVLGSLPDTCAPPGGSFLMEGGTDCSPLSFTVGRAKWRVHLSHSGAVCLIKEFIGRVISPGSGPSRVTL